MPLALPPTSHCLEFLEFWYRHVPSKVCKFPLWWECGYFLEPPNKEKFSISVLLVMWILLWNPLKMQKLYLSLSVCLFVFRFRQPWLLRLCADGFVRCYVYLYSAIISILHFEGRMRTEKMRTLLMHVTEDHCTWLLLIYLLSYTHCFCKKNSDCSRIWESSNFPPW